MNQNIKITIEEWANDNDIQINDSQIKELGEAIEICGEIDMYECGLTPGHHNKSESDIVIEILKNKINQLEGFIREKGYWITYNEKSITERNMIPILSSHCASHDKTYRY